jgi:hypothetical protein
MAGGTKSSQRVQEGLGEAAVVVAVVANGRANAGRTPRALPAAAPAGLQEAAAQTTAAARRIAGVLEFGHWFRWTCGRWMSEQAK